MTVTTPLTTSPGHWEPDVVETLDQPALAWVATTPGTTRYAVLIDLARFMQRYPRPDPSARLRMAELLHDRTGWGIFPEINSDREYVTRLWAEDWDCPEDSVYDD